MWLLVFICTLTGAVGVPINVTHGATGHAQDNVTVTSQPVTAEAFKVGEVHLDYTHNVTVPAPGIVVSELEPQQDSAETIEELQGHLLVEGGDVLMQDDRNAVQILWPDATVPYTISPELANRESNILAAFKMISDVTCIRFVKHTTEFNYLKFLNGQGCASFVGCQGGAQNLYYGSTCSVGNLCHEIIHALGLHHEHTRKDRDQYITVQWENILPGRQSNFRTKSGNTQNLPYDLDSIMHYGPYYFSQHGNPTVLSKQGGAHMGQRTHLSHLDIKRLNMLYHCEERMRDSNHRAG